jgi:hypothetical protein
MFMAKLRQPNAPPQNLDLLSFRVRGKEPDPVRTVLFIAAAIACLALVAAMIAVLTITPPTL